MLDQFEKATRSASASIAHDMATSASSERVGLGMRLPLCRAAPPSREPGGWMREDTGNRALLLSPKGIVSAGHPTEAGACVHAPVGGRSLTSTIRSAGFGYAYACRPARPRKCPERERLYEAEQASQFECCILGFDPS